MLKLVVRDLCFIKLNKRNVFLVGRSIPPHCLGESLQVFQAAREVIGCKKANCRLEATFSFPLVLSGCQILMNKLGQKAKIHFQG